MICKNTNYFYSKCIKMPVTTKEVLTGDRALPTTRTGYLQPTIPNNQRVRNTTIKWLEVVVYNIWDVWELRPPRWIPSTAVFEGVDICAEEQRSGCSGPWFPLSCYMAVRLGASEPVSAAVWILLVPGHFAGSWAIVGTTSYPMIDFSVRLGLPTRLPAWYDNANCDYLDTWRGTLSLIR